ncbi:hypothetical protein [Longimicrobium sp.]|uniref:hypothetical protein n=1 Tax=Longimicrobium sp. TaxID=2029185 RepID=UPI002E379505|nr:hypothetical protein [Longimicrobium sp.]HEX6041255.1 hypothetical protein [Longimicrobium sp.]
MKRIWVAAVLPLLFLAGCSGERPTDAEFFGIARQVLQFAERDARQNQPGRVADGPLYVNVASFRTAANRVTGLELTQDSVSKALGEPTDAMLEQALLCDTDQGFGGCWVRKYGVWVNLNLVRHAGDELTAFVRSTSTNRTTRPTDFCDRVWVLDFRKEGGQWRMAKQRLQRDCRQPES